METWTWETPESPETWRKIHGAEIIGATCEDDGGAWHVEHAPVARSCIRARSRSELERDHPEGVRCARCRRWIVEPAPGYCLSHGAWANEYRNRRPRRCKYHGEYGKACRFYAAYGRG
jgi:hypothetical protein